MFRYNPLPDSRQDFHKNQLPITHKDISLLAEKHGEELAENARICAQEIILRGGVNPRSIEIAFPDGVDGNICVDGLRTIIKNMSEWWEHRDINSL